MPKVTEMTKMNTKKTDSIKKQSSPVKTKKTEIKKSAEKKDEKK